MESVIIRQDMMENLDNIFIAYPDVSIFYLDKGTYKLTKQLDVTKDNIRIIGLTNNAADVHIFQENINANGINIKANNFTMHYISIHLETGDKVCLSHSDANWTNIQNCHFYGSDTNFTVYFAGPNMTAGQETLDNYNNDVLDKYNIFDNNVVYTMWEGDAVSFALQKHGSVRNNIIRGGKIAIYMVKECIVTHNTVHESSSHGIVCSLPSHNLEVCNNYIKKSTSASINVRPQGEHGVFTGSNYNIVIKDNTIIDSKYIGIEIKEANSVIITNNTIKWVDQFSIYLLKSTNITIDANKCIEGKRGINLDLECTDNTIINNKIYSVFPKLSEHALVMQDLNSNNVADKNYISGTYTSTHTKDVTDTNTFTNTTINNYHDSQDEIIIMG